MMPVEKLLLQFLLRSLNHNWLAIGLIYLSRARTGEIKFKKVTWCQWSYVLLQFRLRPMNHTWYVVLGFSGRSRSVKSRLKRCIMPLQLVLTASLKVTEPQTGWCTWVIDVLGLLAIVQQCQSVDVAVRIVTVIVIIVILWLLISWLLKVNAAV